MTRRFPMFFAVIEFIRNNVGISILDLYEKLNETIELKKLKSIVKMLIEFDIVKSKGDFKNTEYWNSQIWINEDYLNHDEKITNVLSTEDLRMNEKEFKEWKEMNNIDNDDVSSILSCEKDKPEQWDLVGITPGPELMFIRYMQYEGLEARYVANVLGITLKNEKRHWLPRLQFLDADSVRPSRPDPAPKDTRPAWVRRHPEPQPKAPTAVRKPRV